MTDELIMNARARAKAGSEQRLVAELRTLMVAAHSEPGCISYDVHQLADDPQEFMIHESWASPAALDTHLKSPQMQAFFAQLPQLIEGQPDMKTWKKVR